MSSSSSSDIPSLLERIQAGDFSATLERDLCYAINLLCDKLIEEGHYSKADWIWTKTIEIAELYPACMLRLSYARHLISREKTMKAFEVLDQCHRLNPENLAVFEARENAKGFIVDRWHYRMLNDQPRNFSYRSAIQFAVQQQQQHQIEVTVLDIGGGTGLLSCFAVLAGADHVYCCEMNSALSEIARQCVESNGLQDKITVICKHSKDLVIGRDIPSRVSIIVTELVDSGTLGEHIVDTLRDARLRLLATNGIVIPHSCRIHGLAISSDDIGKRNTFNHHEFLHPPWREGMSALQQMVHFVPDETYTCEDIATLLQTEITDCTELFNLPLDGSDTSSTPGSSVSICRVLCDARIDAIATWFSMFLLDPSIVHQDWNHVSSAPGRSMCGWDQAIHFSSHINGSYKTGDLVHRDDLLTIVTTIDGDKLQFSVSIESFPLKVQQLSSITFPVGEADIALLNDSYRLNAYITAIKEIFDLSDTKLNILEVSGTIQSPLTFLLMLIQSSSAKANNEFTSKLGYSLIYSAPEHKEILASLIKLFKIPERSMTILSEEMLLSQAKLLELPNSSIFDLIICDPIESCGLLSSSALRDVHFAWEMMSRVKRDFRVIPQAFSVVVAAIECFDLIQQHKVMRERTLDVKLYYTHYSFR